MSPGHGCQRVADVSLLNGTRGCRLRFVQLRRKVRAMAEEIKGDADFAADLRIGTVNPDVRGWIVDTSLDYCGQKFGGFPTVALEEILIALRDDGRPLRQVDRRGLLKLWRRPGIAAPRTLR